LLVSVADESGEKRKVGVIQPGTCFGEMSILSDLPRNATLVAAQAGGDVVVLEVVRPALRLLRSLKKFADKIDLSYRLHGLGNTIAAIQEDAGDALSAVDLIGLGNLGQFMTYGKHHLLVQEGKPIEKLILIRNGWVRRVRGVPIYRNITEGTGSSLLIPEDFLGAGNCLGLEALSGQAVWQFSAALMARTEVLEVPLVELRADRGLCERVARAFADFSLADDDASLRARAETKVLAAAEKEISTALYAYLYVVDKFEGLILVDAATLLDGDPLNNYLQRQLDPNKYPNGAFNPDGALAGANSIVIAGTYAYITTDRELVIVNLNDPLQPGIAGRIAAPQLKHPRSIAIQFRYGFVADDEGLKVIDLTQPERARLVEGALVSLAEARDVYVARTYAYVAGRKDGVAIIDVKRPEKPRLEQIYNAAGKLNDVHQVKIAMTNASLFAYVADGRNGLRVLQLTSPETMPTYAGFSPRPEPQLIATFKTKGDALAISKALDRDRAVDESGNQIAVFGRRGARPFTFQEIQRMLRTNEGRGEFFTVADEPGTEPRGPKAAGVSRSSALVGALLGLLVAVAAWRMRAVGQA